ncbi:hypothetical protein ElyMa_002092200 [Elysia marginata]|uniref:SMB domain-containing protein n=1 Tax=Elysia marginata TaxID=1093978 RepID=A0AAV4FEM9_9GAST|nr:hypothetical protein ElyMa_002092200 [Elysia marginata]
MLSIILMIGLVEILWFSQTEALPALQKTQIPLSAKVTSVAAGALNIIDLYNERNLSLKILHSQNVTANPTPVTDLASISSSMRWRSTDALPWYLSDLSGYENTSGSNQNQSGTFDLTEKLVEIKEILNPFGIAHSSIIFVIHNIRYRMGSSSQLKDIVSEQNLCSQADLLIRTSCRGRCGQLPDTTNVPAQCACDHDCLANADCCEDINELCTETFVQTVSNFYLQRRNFAFTWCHRYRLQMLDELYRVGKSIRSEETTIIEFECLSEIHMSDVLHGILGALTISKCRSKLWSMDQFVRSRVCDRPDVLVCEEKENPQLYSFYPVHLTCFGHPSMDRLAFRYQNGLDDMEVVSKHGNCSYLRETNYPSSGYQNGYNLPANRSMWRKNQFKKIKLIIKSHDGQTYFHFETSNRGRVRCTGGPSVSDWRCESTLCSDGHLFHKTSQTCYLPDRAYLRLTPLAADSQPGGDVQSKQGDGGNNADDVNAHEGVDAARPSSNFDLCTCFKAKAVLSSIGWWRVLIETQDLINGRCGFNLDNSSQELVYSTNRNDDTDGHKVYEANGTRPSTSSPNVNEEVNTYERSLLFGKLLVSWNNRRNECIEEKFRAVQVCFALTKRPDLGTLCLFLHDRAKSGGSDVNVQVSSILTSGCRNCRQTRCFQIAVHIAVILLSVFRGREIPK